MFIDFRWDLKIAIPSIWYLFHYWTSVFVSTLIPDRLFHSFSSRKNVLLRIKYDDLLILRH